MSDGETVLVPGGREVRASLDAGEADACVVACPPHPQMGGTRSDRRLRAVADAIAPDVATLRVDYGAWDGGRGELADARNALAWARGRYAQVGVFGYSFGGCLAVAATARESAAGRTPPAVATLAPAARIGDGIDAAAAVESVACPGYVCYGERDTTVEWEPVVARARERGWTVESMGADHHFVGQTEAVGERCGGFLRETLGY